ncbi:toll-like receptor 2 [Saccostrea echinata]|uniref:toll-like receptor 2 n=1 Tax=Saccostrea echinata TaxID=191078 RepID=UPI002A80A799|nr:toll-like receptor 2 [Saccostrea echinata]
MNMDILKTVRYVYLFICLMNFEQTITSEGYLRELHETSTVPSASTTSITSTGAESNEFNWTNDTPVAPASYLPPHWEEFCILQERGTNQTVHHYTCFINTSFSGKWNFSVLRQHILTKDIKYGFDVRCQNGATISLPLSAKARNIIKLYVHDCVAVDYFADFQNPDLDSYPDELEEYAIINVQRLLSIKQIERNLQIKSETLPKNVICGDEETLKIKIERNETFSFIQDVPELDLTLFSRIATGNIIDTRLSPHKCVFKKLQVLENSVTSSKARYYAAMLTEQNQFPELKVFNISHSFINYIPEQFKNWWIYFEKLEYLDMSYNLIQDILFPINNDGIWGQHIPNLIFDFTFNNISRLTVRNFERIIRNKKIFVKITSNPFNCTCTDEMKEVLKYIQDTDWSSAKYKRYAYFRDLRCETPENVRGWRLADLTLRDINCKFELMPVTVALSVLSFILIICIVVILKYRREIRILVYTRFNVVLPCQPAEIYEHKEFDAFVSYSNDDQEWVCSIFDENKHDRLVHLKFCMHHKDFIPGKTIFENIVKCIENSRHTVIVLSENFLKSHFCLWEFQEAFQQSIVERKRHLIIILLEDIPDKDLPNDLKRCMKTFTYIRRDDKIFFDRLLYSLSYKGKAVRNPKLAQINPGYDDKGNKEDDKVNEEDVIKMMNERNVIMNNFHERI